MMIINEKINTFPKIMPLQPHQRDRALEVITRAFKNDPMTSYLSPDVRIQAHMLRWLAQVGINYGEAQGQVYTTPEVNGVAIWFGPGRASAAVLLRAAMLLPFQVGLRCFWRFLRFLIYADRLHHGIISGEHLHLFILVVDPECQGQGWGSELVKPLLAQADNLGRPCYLETSNPRALTFYRKHGFEVVHHAVIGPGGPDFWSLLRNTGRTAAGQG